MTVRTKTLREAYIGMDVGTSGVRALLVQEDGSVAAVEETPHETSLPRPGWAEQDPFTWAAGAIEVLRRLGAIAASEGLTVRGLGLTGQMHGATFLGADDRPLRPAIIWMDQRSEAEARWLDGEMGANLLARTRNHALPNMTATKAVWLRRNEPRVFERVRALLLPKDYVRLVLTGDKATDVSDASGTLFLDVPRRCWSDEMQALASLPVGALPAVFESPEVTGTLLPALADATGLARGLPVVAGAGDQAAGAVGAGVRTPGLLMVSLGTSGVVFGATAEPPSPVHASVHAFCHALPDAWHWMGVTQAAGGSLKWLRQAVGGSASYEELDAEAAKVEPGSEGLVFLPYLMGERAPLLDSSATGAFAGLTVRHTRAHLVRAVMEGVAFSLRHVLDVVEGDVAAPGAVRMIGGGAKSPLWRPIVAAALKRTVERVTSPEGAAFGAAILAAQGAKGDSGVARDWVQTARDAAPARSWPERYEERYQAYKSLYPVLSAWARTAPDPGDGS